MAFYMHVNGKRGRPTRFEERDHAVITAVAMVLDARHRVRGRHPDTSSLIITTQSENTTVADSLSDTFIIIKDSVKVKDAYKSPPVVKKVKPVKAAFVPPAEVSTKSLAPRTFGRTIDISTIRAKIAMVTKEAEQKGIDVTTNH